MGNRLLCTTVTLKDKRAIAGQNIDLDAELAKFEAEERKRLGLDGQDRALGRGHGRPHLHQDREEQDHHARRRLDDGAGLLRRRRLCAASATTCSRSRCPTVEALQYGKEFGNRGQCNPTYFTVGNLVKFLCTLRDKHGMSAKDIVDNYVFLTAGACGPCRFGMYTTEYRKALRDAGFDGFRVVLFQQTGGISQATGDESGLELNPTFFWAIVKALFAGDVVNALGYRIRPYEK